jgi:DNA-binding transcriptional LysR family regulator
VERENWSDLLAFLAVARERSFTRAAAQLGVSQSALSHTISALEKRLGLRLLNRSGSIRITTGSHAADTILWPVLRKFLPDYPEVKVQIVVRIGPDMRMAAIAAPAYLAKRPRIRAPRDLTRYVCINLRFPMHGGLCAWEFEKNGREVRVRVEGQLTFNGLPQVLNAALAGFGLA